MRPAILRDVERLYGMHDAFKSQLESISPQSAETWTDGIPIRKPAIIRKIQNQSLLARSMKRRIEAEIRKEWADPSEALMVAKEIDKLVGEKRVHDKELDDLTERKDGKIRFIRGVYQNI